MKNKIMISIFVAVLIIASVAMVSATIAPEDEDIETSCYQNFNPESEAFSFGYSHCTKAITIVTGRIYYDDNDDAFAPKAEVNVTCYHGNKITTKNTTSLNKPGLRGVYIVAFSQKNCKDGDRVVVEASESWLTGINEGIVDNTFIKKIDLAIVNVALIPEFSTTVGILTALGAVSTFFLVRRK